MPTNFLSLFAPATRAPSPRNNPMLNLPSSAQIPSILTGGHAPGPTQFRIPNLQSPQVNLPFVGSAQARNSFTTSPFTNQKTWDVIKNRLFPQLDPNYRPPSTINTGNTSAGGDPNNARGLDGTNQWDSLMKQASTESGTPWQVLAAIMGIESGGQNLTANSAGAVGLMQVVPKYWQDLANQYGGDLSNPYTNIRTAADILKMNYDKYGSWDKAAAAYFGAIDANGNITGAQDSFGTDGYTYVNLFRNNLAALGYGVPSPSEVESGGNGATPWASGALQSALTMQGVPYVLGGDTPGGFDCSGLVEWAYGQQGKYFGRTAQQQFENTQRISSDQLQAGDLVFFTGTNPDNPNPVTHVGIYMGNGQMLEAPKEGDIVKIVSIADPFWQSHLYGYGRVV